MSKIVESVTVSGGEPPTKKWVEPVTALVMALATLSTAWCSYEAAAWTRKSNRLMNESTALRDKAGLLTVQGLQLATIHVGMFMQFLAAQQEGNQKLADLYLGRFPPELRKAFDAWMAQKPLENPQADLHPFVSNLYQSRGAQEAAEVTTQSEKKLEEARNAGTVSGQYLANTVLFATVLFFAAATSKFTQRRVRIVSFLFAT